MLKVEALDLRIPSLQGLVNPHAPALRELGAVPWYRRRSAARRKLRLQVVLDHLFEELPRWVALEASGVVGEGHQSHVSLETMLPVVHLLLHRRRLNSGLRILVRLEGAPGSLREAVNHSDVQGDLLAGSGRVIADKVGPMSPLHVADRLPLGTEACLPHHGNPGRTDVVVPGDATPADLLHAENLLATSPGGVGPGRSSAVAARVLTDYLCTHYS